MDLMQSLCSVTAGLFQFYCRGFTAMLPRLCSQLRVILLSHQMNMMNL